jgi:hypothetical protein
MTDPARHVAQAPGPAPGEVVATFEVPVQGPNEQQVTDAAVANGGIIALVIVVGLVASLLAWLWRQMAVRIIGAVAIAVFITVMIMKGSR